METAIWTIVFFTIIAAPAVYYFVRRRRDDRLVRIWVDEHHYALLSLRGPVGWHMVFPGLGLLAGVRPGTWIFELKVQDEQGGQFTLNVQTSFSGQIDIQRQ